MKTDSIKITTFIRSDIYERLKTISKDNNQSMTKVIEDAILKRDKLNKKNKQIIDDIKEIINIYKSNYNQVRSISINLNQLTFNLHINELANSDEVVDIIELIRNITIQNTSISQAIIKKLDRLTNTKTKLTRRQKINKKVIK